MSKEKLNDTLSEAKELKDEKLPKKRTLADGRKLRYGALAAGLTAVVIVAVLLLNVIAGILDTKYPLTIDVTGTKVLSMSDTFKTFASSVNQKVHITVCIDEETMKTPDTGLNELNLILSQFYSDLKQLKVLSNNNVTYEFVDLTKDVKKASALEEYELQSGSILFKSGKRTATAHYSDLYTGDDNFQQMMMQYQYYGTMSGGEYTLTSNVEQLLVTNVQVVLNANLHPVTMIVGHGENETLITNLTELLTKNGYEVKTLGITTMDNAFDPTSTMAILPAPSNDYTADELAYLRNWVANGGKMNHHLVYIVDSQSWLPVLSEFFADDYGIEVTQNWAVETSNSRVFPVNTLFGTYMSPEYTYGDLADSEYTDKADKAAKAPMCAPLKLLWSDDDTMAKYTKPIVTFPDTCQQMNMLDYRAYTEAASAGDESAVPPSPTPAETYPMVGMAYSRQVAMVDGANVSSGALVCGSAEMLSSYLSDTSCENEKVFLASVNGLNGNEKGTFIPGKDIVSPHVEYGSEGSKKFIGIGIFTVGLPLALLLTCLAVFLRRKNL